ncbi:hypothetical protein VFPBJ_00051 [Purpureocillium lilacinum]|uniref:Uncharacterized protein n=1 Tax=Purpureocillium lilacinum TaxID=33203 RepID=A0A179H8Z8_PURLI|nr:hypothetical protein VFPBJ_00051 [Purpureocillium lilacinum]
MVTMGPRTFPWTKEKLRIIQQLEHFIGDRGRAGSVGTGTAVGAAPRAGNGGPRAGRGFAGAPDGESAGGQVGAWCRCML